MSLVEYLKAVGNHANPLTILERFQDWSKTRGDVRWARGDPSNLVPRLNNAQYYLQRENYPRTRLWLDEVYEAKGRSGRVDKPSANIIRSMTMYIVGIQNISKKNEELEKIKESLEALLQKS